MRTKDTLSCFSERTERNYPSIETQVFRQTTILVKFSSYLEQLRQKPRVLLSCTHTHTHTLSLSLSLSLSRVSVHHLKSQTPRLHPVLPSSPTKICNAFSRKQDQEQQQKNHSSTCSYYYCCRCC
jgi:hypothetical protein